MQTVLSVEHFPAAFAICCAEHGVFIDLINQEDPDVVKAEIITDDGRNVGQELLEITNGGNRLSHLGQGLKLACPALDPGIDDFQFPGTVCQFLRSLCYPLLQFCLQGQQLLVTRIQVP